MNASVVLLPEFLTDADLAGKTVVVLDVLRATTTMIAALAAGVGEIRVFSDLDACLATAARGPGPKLLCGERNALKPPGFDLGNSPGSFNPRDHAGLRVYMTTTNGTVAIAAAQSAPQVLIGALVNAGSVARRLAESSSDVTLLCSGTNRRPSVEDLLGAGAILDALLHRQPEFKCRGDLAVAAQWLFRGNRQRLAEILRSGDGGHNVARAKLLPDLEFAAQLDVFDVVGVVRSDPLRVVRAD